MRLGLFRQKLAYEVREVTTLIKTSKHANQEVQAYFYTIAALLRKIMTRVPRFNEIQIPVRSKNETHIRLRTLVNTILHYSRFVPIMRYEPLESIRILSDHDKDSLIREIEVMDFIEVAKQIAEDDRAILDNLLDYTKKRLGKNIHAPCMKRSDENEAMESLMDFFELMRKTGSVNLPDGKITLFREKLKDMKTVEGIQTCEIDYKILSEKIFAEWPFSPFRQFRAYPQNFDELKSGCKIIDLENLSGNRIFEESENINLAGKLFMIRTEDLLDFLCGVKL